MERAAETWRHDDEPLVLGIETSCDETGVGIVRGHTLLADAVASSVDEHARFGGVVPEVASRAHLEAMVPTIERACETAGHRAARRRRDRRHQRARASPARCWSASPRPRRSRSASASRCTASTTSPPTSPSTSSSTARCPSRAWRCWSRGGHSCLLRVERRDRRTSTRWARPSTTRRGRRSTRSPGCSGCRSRAARTSTGRPARVDGHDRLPARADRPRATSSGTASTSRSPGSRPPWPAGSRRGSASGEPVPVADVAASFQEAVCDVLVAQGARRRRRRGHRGPAHRRRRRRQLPAAGAWPRSGPPPRGIRVRVPRPGLCTDNGAMVAALGSEMVAPRPAAVAARPARRLLAAGDRGAGVSSCLRARAYGRLRGRTPGRRTGHPFRAGTASLERPVDAEPHDAPARALERHGQEACPSDSQTTGCQSDLGPALRL